MSKKISKDDEKFIMACLRKHEKALVDTAAKDYNKLALQRERINKKMREIRESFVGYEFTKVKRG